MSRKRVFLHNPVPLRCPDCAEPTPVEVSSLLGTLNTATAQTTPTVLKHIMTEARDRWSAAPFKATTRHRILCSSCEKHFPKVHWVVLGVDHLAGPWCIQCLRTLVWTEIEGEKGLSMDLYVLAIAATQDALRQAHNVRIDNEHTSSDEPDLVF